MMGLMFIAFLLPFWALFSPGRGIFMWPIGTIATCLGDHTRFYCTVGDGGRYPHFELNNTDVSAFHNDGVQYSWDGSSPMVLLVTGLLGLNSSTIVCVDGGTHSVPAYFIVQDKLFSPVIANISCFNGNLSIFLSPPQNAVDLRLIKYDVYLLSPSGSVLHQTTINVHQSLLYIKDCAVCRPLCVIKIVPRCNVSLGDEVNGTYQYPYFDPAIPTRSPVQSTSQIIATPTGQVGLSETEKTVIIAVTVLFCVIFLLLSGVAVLVPLCWKFQKKSKCFRIPRVEEIPQRPLLQEERPHSPVPLMPLSEPLSSEGASLPAAEVLRERHVQIGLQLPHQQTHRDVLEQPVTTQPQPITNSLAEPLTGLNSSSCSTQYPSVLSKGNSVLLSQCPTLLTSNNVQISEPPKHSLTTVVTSISDGSTPTANGSTPTANDSTPIADCSTPTANDSTPTANGSTPTANGSTPTADGFTPTAYGSTPTANGSTLTANGSTPAADGSTPKTDGSTPTAVHHTDDLNATVDDEEEDPNPAFVVGSQQVSTETLDSSKKGAEMT